MIRKFIFLQNIKNHIILLILIVYQNNKLVKIIKTIKTKWANHQFHNAFLEMINR